MAKPGTIIGQITEELGELGKKVVTEVAKAPVDIVAGTFEKRSKEKNPVQDNNPVQPDQEKEPVAPRRMLEQFAKREKPEPSVYEKKIMEEQEKKETVKKQTAATAWQQLPNTGAAARRGDPQNIAKKQAGTETGKNIVNQ